MPSDTWTKNTKHLQISGNLKIETYSKSLFPNILYKRQVYILQQVKQKADNHIFAQYCI